MDAKSSRVSGLFRENDKWEGKYSEGIITRQQITTGCNETISILMQSKLPENYLKRMK